MTAPYTAGTVSLVSGSEAVAGIDTAWAVSLIVGGTIYVEFDGGNPLPIATVDSDTEITAALKWTGPTGTYSYAIVRDTAYGQQAVTNAQALATYIQRLNNPALAATAGVTPGSNKLLLFTGANSATVIDLEDLLQGVKFDEEVPTLADRATYDGEAEGFRVLVANIGDGRSAFYTKKSAAVGDWTVPFYITGPVGGAGPYTDITIGPTETLPAGADAEVTLVPVSPGVIRLDFGLPKGADGTGTGDFVGPSGGVSIGDIVAFANATGKAGRKATPSEVKVAAGMTTGPLNEFKNKVINGDFQNWQRGLSQTTSGYGSDDRWANENAGTTKTHSRQAFALGQSEVPGSPEFFSRTVVASVAGANNLCRKVHRIEGVRTFSGKRATLTFYAKADAAKNIVVELAQEFGTGGSPSAFAPFQATTIALTTQWKRFDIVVDVPSITGKTLGTSGTDHLGVLFWFDAGSSLNSRLNNLGQQSGTFDIAHVSFVEGDATAEADPFGQRAAAQELALCLRYCEVLTQPLACSFDSTSVTHRVNWVFKVRKRATPSIYIGAGSSSPVIASVNTDGARANDNSGGVASLNSGTIADAEI